MNHVLELLELVKYYYVNDLEIDAFGCRSDMKKYLAKNDPGRKDVKIKEEAFLNINDRFKKYAEACASEELRDLKYDE